MQPREQPLELRLDALIRTDGPRMPLPAKGNTLLRWQTLAAVAAEDLALVKLFEGHTDAVAILSELGGPAPAAGSVWGTWAAEPPTARLELRRFGHTAGTVSLSGRKAWCSGARAVTHAVVTAWDERSRPCLAAVALEQPGVTVTDTGWHAVGMGRVASGDVLFDDASGLEIGEPGAYLARPGFGHGGCGIAACWYGGAVPLAVATAAELARRDDPHTAAHLGAIDVALSSMRARLRQAAEWIDGHPVADANELALAVRGAAESAVGTVLTHAGRALGAGPLCRDELIARRYADLPVFLRQSHAERDLAVLGGLIAGSASGASRWSL